MATKKVLPDELPLEALDHADDELPLEALDAVDGDTSAIKAFGLSLMEGINPEAISNMAKSKASAMTNSPDTMVDIAKPEYAPSSGASFEQAQPEFQKIQQDELNRLGKNAEDYPGASFAGSMSSMVVPSPTDLMVPDIGRLKDPMAKYFKDFGKGKAFEAMRPLKKFTKAITKKEQERIGDQLLKSGVVDVVPKTKSQMLDAVSEAKDIAGSELDDAIEVLSTYENKLKTGALPGEQMLTPQGAMLREGKAGVNSAMVLDKALSESLPSARLPGGDKIMGKLQELAIEFEAKNPGFIPVKEAEQLKRELNQFIPWKKLKEKGIAELSTEEKFYVNLYHNLKTGVEDAAEFIAKHSDAPIDKEKFVKIKQKWGDLKQSEDILRDSVAAATSNRSVSLTDTIAGTAGLAAAAASGSGPGVMAAAPVVIGAANKAMRTFGPQVTSKASYSLGELLSKDANMFGKFAPVLRQMSTAPRAASNMMLSKLAQDQEFKAISDSVMGVEVEPGDAGFISEQIKKKVKDPIKRAKMLDRLHRDSRLIMPEELE